MTSRPISSSQSLLNSFEVIADIQPFQFNECELFAGQYFGYSRYTMERLILDRERLRAYDLPLPLEWGSTIESIRRIAWENEVICSVPIVLLILCYIAKLELEQRHKNLKSLRDMHDDLFVRDMSIVSLYHWTTKCLVVAQNIRKKNSSLQREVDWDKLEVECEKYFLPLRLLCFGIVGDN
jgi:hypothetical protein